jgi:hypothetical protein
MTPELADRAVERHVEARRTHVGKQRQDRGCRVHGLLPAPPTTLTGDHIADAPKQLTQIERGWRDMKGALTMRSIRFRRFTWPDAKMTTGQVGAGRQRQERCGLGPTDVTPSTRKLVTYRVVRPDYR